MPLYYGKVQDNTIVDKSVWATPMDESWPNANQWIPISEEVQIGWAIEKGLDEITFIPPIQQVEEVRKAVPKSTIISRLYALKKLDAAVQVLNSNTYTRERWYASDKPEIYVDDPEAIALLKAIGVDPSDILK